MDDVCRDRKIDEWYEPTETVCSPVSIEDSEFILVKNILKENKHRFLNVKEISRLAGLPIGSTCVKTRKIITALIEVHNLPIVSTNYGYKLTDKISVIVAYQNNLQSRIQAIQKRIKALSRSSDDIMINLQDA